MALTLAQKSSCRLHLNYPLIGLYKLGPGGATLAQGAAGYRFFQAYGFLEYKMNNLNPDEEARLTGQAYAGAALSGAQPSPGDTVTVTLSGGNIASPQTLTATAPNPPTAGDQRLVLAAALASACALNPVLQAAGVIGVAPYGTGPYAQAGAVPIPEVGFTSSVPFTIAVGGVSAVCALQITATGTYLPPSAIADPNGVITSWGYLPILDTLLGAWAGSSQNLDTIKADVWTGRANEAGARISLYRNWQGQLSRFLGTPICKWQPGDQERYGAVRYA